MNFPFQVPHNRGGDFEQLIIKKNSDLEEKIIVMYAKEMSMRGIQDHFGDLYGTDIFSCVNPKFNK